MPDVEIPISFDGGAPADVSECIAEALKNKQLNTLKEYFEKGIYSQVGNHYNVMVGQRNYHGRPIYSIIFYSNNDKISYAIEKQKIKTSDAIVKFLNEESKKNK
jgi:hypothetical protein